jgi:hypothetical protein
MRSAPCWPNWESTYGKPIVVYSRDAQLIRNSPRAVQRVTSIDGVKRFLQAHV